MAAFSTSSAGGVQRSSGVSGIGAILSREDGFTLIELLVVIMVIGILTAIALPSFLEQRQKGADASVKATVRTALGAGELMKIDTDTYPNDVALLVQFEPSLSNATNLTITGNTTSFRVSAQSTDLLRTFWVERQASGFTVRGCSPAGEGGCLDNGSW